MAYKVPCCACNSFDSAMILGCMIVGILCYGGVVAEILLGGQSLNFVYLLSNPNGTMKLGHFIFLFGTLVLVLAQISSFHSLRHINLVSLILCLAYGACATAAGSIYIGNSKNAPIRDYSINRAEEHRISSAFNAISIIITTYTCAVLPEIQATIAPPVKGKMFEGLCLCSGVVVTTFFNVPISGYWSFGNQAMAKTVLANFMGDDKYLLPIWFLLMTKVFTLLQVSAVSMVCLQPINEIIENKFSDPNVDQFSIRNVVPRVIFRSTAAIIATIFATVLPFFGDIMALLGAFGCIPLGLILPMLFYNLTVKPSKLSLVFLANTSIVVVNALARPRWGKYVVGPLQFGICYVAVIAGVLLGGQSLKFIYLLSNPNGTMKLYLFTTIFGVLMLFLAQIPSFHSLRHINLVSLFLALA
ncbi:GABA transporter 1-like [Alnus glutinosa]|uniref:GABA transporter 1-like n=1 Tax=Alnus glutinosa TaxID=3517 RepID=UPI002D7801DB|nr:GABA transporter 1-like [Alnus glutinosa]